MKIKVLLVDDHVMMRSGLRALLQADVNLDVIGEATDGRAAVQMAAKLSPQIVIMDLRMPEMNGIEATRQVVAANSKVKVIGLSTNTDRQSASQMLRAGASGYVLKESAFEELSCAIQEVMKDKIYLSPALTGTEGDDCEDGVGTSAYTVLTAREREVLQMISEGKATKEVAMRLHVSVKTVETHRRNLMEKLRVDSVAELTKYAIREGLTSV